MYWGLHKGNIEVTCHSNDELQWTAAGSLRVVMILVLDKYKDELLNYTMPSY